MTIRKVLVKNNHSEAVIKVVNDANIADTITINLATDLLKNNETISGTPRVAIRACEWSVEDSVGVILISRGGVVTQRLHSSTNMPWALGADHEGDDQNIVVAMSGGTITMHLLKVKGYLPNFQPEIHGGE